MIHSNSDKILTLVLGLLFLTCVVPSVGPCSSAGGNYHKSKNSGKSEKEQT